MQGGAGLQVSGHLQQHLHLPQVRWILFFLHQILIFISRSFTSAGQSVFCQFEDDESFEEYYDLDADPWQLINLALTMEDDLLSEERNMLADLAKCKGQDCQKYNSGPVSGSHKFGLNFMIFSLCLNFLRMNF